jgi:hypothetical protein
MTDFYKIYVIIARENQWTCFYGIKRKHLSHDNPPVFMKGVIVRKHWKKTCNLQDFLEDFLVRGNYGWYTMSGKNYYPKSMRPLDPLILELGNLIFGIDITEDGINEIINRAHPEIRKFSVTGS